MKKFKLIWEEFKHHVPFTFFATVFAVVLTIIFFDFVGVENVTKSFYILHPAHILISAIVSAGIFYKYKHSILFSLLIGVSGSVLIGSLSDIILPYLGGLLFGLRPEFHLELIESPLLILSAGIFGSVLGIITNWTKGPHFLHVLLSIFASLFYLLAFTAEINLFAMFSVGFIVFIAVLIPCCVSDIVFPLLFVRKGK